METLTHGNFQVTLFGSEHADEHGRIADKTKVEKTRKALQYLGPWCPNCGRKGKRCKDERACLVRSITAKPCPKGVTLSWGGDLGQKQDQAYYREGGNPNAATSHD